MSKSVSVSFACVLSFLLAAPALAMSCADFNRIGEARSPEEFTRTKPTSAQIEAFKSVVANRAGQISGFHIFSKRKKVIDDAMENNTLVWFVANSLSITRDECLRSPKKVMVDVAVDNFDFLIDAAAEKL